MTESVSGQAHGGLKAPQQAPAPAAFRDPRTFVSHAYDERTADLGEVASELMTQTGAAVEYVSLPDAAHAMHAADPKRFADIVIKWAKQLPH